jgi:hypothetical protein
MREHKYRAWHPRNEAFEYWTLSDFWRNGWMCCSHTEPLVPCSVPSDTYGAFAVLAEWEEYTGLTDKNGREIYEGDIIRAWIDFGPGGEGLREYVVTLTEWGHNIQQWPYQEKGFYPPEVIGNIHEDAELLDHKPGPSAE